MTGSTKEQPFDEQAALAELERFRRDIERYRMQRDVVGQKFDTFIESFPAPEDVFPTEAAAAPPAPAEKKAPVAETIPLPPLPKRETSTAAPAPPTAASQVKTAAPPPRPASDDIDLATHTMGAKPRESRRTPMLAAVIVIVLMAGVVAMWSFRRGASDPKPQAAAPPAAEPAQPSAAPPAAPAPAPAESEIRTIRRAWVRVIADGERVVERELPADSRIPFKADKTIVVRTGDAGAVKLSIRGQDQGLMGRDGQVVTRTFTVADTPRR